MIQQSGLRTDTSWFGEAERERFIRDSKASEKKYRERHLTAYRSRTGTKGNEVGYWLVD